VFGTGKIDHEDPIGSAKARLAGDEGIVGHGRLMLLTTENEKVREDGVRQNGLSTGGLGEAAFFL
jgi:hypothetical protein